MEDSTLFSKVKSPTFQTFITKNFLGIVFLLVLGVIGLPIAFRSIKLVPVGYVGILEGGGAIAPQILTPGLKWVSPFSEVNLVSTRLQDVKEEIETTSVEGLKYDVEVSLQYRLVPEKVLSMYQTLGTDNDTVIISRFRSLVREVTATYPLQDAITLKRKEVAAHFKQRLQESLAPLGFIVDEVLLREITLPENTQQAINDKITAQQESEKMAFQVDKANQEAKIKKIQAEAEAQAQLIEAKSQHDAQKLLSNSLTPSILKLKSIEAAEKIGTSSNARVYVGLGGSQSGELVPLFDQLLESRPTQSKP